MSELNILTEFIKKDFNKSLRSFPFPREPKYLYEPIKYALTGSGKRIRPIILHLYGMEVNADPNDLMKLSLAIELLHCFTLVHDDIMDSDNLRRGALTVHKKFDISSAILAGDGIFTIGQLVLTELNNPRIFKLFNHTVLDICEGQGFDKQFEELDIVTMKDYINMIEKKTGALIGSCLSLPASLVGKTDEEINKVKSIGCTIGIAFQIQDDLLEIFSEEKNMGKSLGSDILYNKKTAIAIEASNSFKSEWNNLINRFDGKNIDDIRSFLIRNKIKDKIDKLVKEYFSLAFQEMEKIGIRQDSSLYKFIKKIEGRYS